jgi:uncharacterized paraquat-inducible protein A
MIVLVAYALGYVALCALLAHRFTTRRWRILGDVRRCAACHLALAPADSTTCPACDAHAYQAWVQSLPVTEPAR